MATLREVRQRISGVKQTQKITKAMKMVAAAKLRRAQSSVVAARPYARHMREVLAHLTPGEGEQGDALLQARPVEKIGMLVVTTDRGLCGGFNTNIVRATQAHLASAYPGFREAGKVKLFCVGRKGLESLTRLKLPIAARYPGVFDHLSFSQAQMIAGEVVAAYLRGDVDRVDVIYNEFKSAAQQRIVVERFLPLVPEKAEGPAHLTDYLFEPSREDLLTALLPKHINFQIWRILLESNASEQGARMAAMENATENANEMISTLQLQYNKARQAAITKELLEVVSGAEALRADG